MPAERAVTLEDLLDVAEKLFAAEGIENVPLTRIVATSGQKNRSALHYYFGSREGVVAAVLDRRLKVINERRARLVAEAEAQGGALDAVLRAAVKSLGDVVLEEPWGMRYISILAQVVFHPQLLGERDVNRANLTALKRGRALIEAALPCIAPQVLSRRVRWFSESCVVALARWARDTKASRQTRAAMEFEIDELVAYGAAALAAPVAVKSNRTMRRLHVQNARG